MEAVRIPARTLVHIGGIPVYLVTETIVETAHGNMSQLVGHHYAHVPDSPEMAQDETMSVEHEHRRDHFDASTAGWRCECGWWMGRDTKVSSPAAAAPPPLDLACALSWADSPDARITLASDQYHHVAVLAAEVERLRSRHAATPLVSGINATVDEMMALLRRVMSSNADGQHIALSPEARDELICSAVARLAKQAIERHVALHAAPEGARQELVETWRRRADEKVQTAPGWEKHRCSPEEFKALHRCADELAALHPSKAAPVVAEGALRALEAKWREHADAANAIVEQYSHGGDGAGNGFAFLKERRIWTTCADALAALREPPK